MAARNGETALPVQEFARFLIELHVLIANGQGDSEDADSLRERMESLWFALDQEDQERFTGLSADLYAMAEDRGGPAAMTPEESRRWG